MARVRIAHATSPILLNVLHASRRARLRVPARIAAP
jgi:hypothetical protein